MHDLEFHVKLLSHRFGWLRLCDILKITALKLIKIDTYCQRRANLRQGH